MAIGSTRWWGCFSSCCLFVCSFQHSAPHSQCHLVSVSSRRRYVLAFRYPSGFAVTVSAEACLIGPCLLSHLVLFAAQSGTHVMTKWWGCFSGCCLFVCSFQHSAHYSQIHWVSASSQRTSVLAFRYPSAFCGDRFG